MRRLLLLAVSAIAGCGYSTSSLLPSHLHTVAVKPVTNSTTQPGVELALTDSLIAVFSADRTLRVVDEQNANLVVETSVTSYSLDPAAYTSDQFVNRYQLSLNIAIEASDQVRDEQLYAGSVSVSVTFSPDSLPAAGTAEEAAALGAAGRCAREAVRRILTAW
jgi:outer membrane lipopolysaccharide assembly protein LptE/RlpB